MRTVLSVAGVLLLGIFFCASGRGEECFCDPCDEVSSLCDSCEDSAECCDCWCDCQRFLGMLPSDHCFNHFISPLSNPFSFEDPRSLTEANEVAGMLNRYLAHGK